MLEHERLPVAVVTTLEKALTEVKKADAKAEGVRNGLVVSGEGWSSSGVVGCWGPRMR